MTNEALLILTGSCTLVLQRSINLLCIHGVIHGLHILHILLDSSPIKLAMHSPFAADAYQGIMCPVHDVRACTVPFGLQYRPWRIQPAHQIYSLKQVSTCIHTNSCSGLEPGICQLLQNHANRWLMLAWAGAQYSYKSWCRLVRTW